MWHSVERYIMADQGTARYSRPQSGVSQEAVEGMGSHFTLLYFIEEAYEDDDDVKDVDENEI